MFTAWLLPLLFIESAPSGASEVRTCIENKTQAGYADEWRSRSLEVREVTPSETSYLMVQLTRGLEYRLFACGDTEVLDLDLVLYDANGRLREQTDTRSREPEIVYKPNRSGAYFLGFQIFEPATSKGNVALAIGMSYR